MLLPLVFLVVAILAFPRISINLNPIIYFERNNNIKYIVFIFLFYTSLIIFLKFSKLYHYNYVLFDSGLYVNKLYKIAQEYSLNNKNISISIIYVL